MVSIYLMGHREGNINVPVLYVNHKAYDYNGKEVTQGMLDPFIESLVHDSIIVQIPLLHGKISKRLNRVLSVFDQSKADCENPQLLCLNDDKPILVTTTCSTLSIATLLLPQAQGCART